MLDPMGDRTLTDLLAERVAAYPDRTFLVFEDADGAVSELTYREFGERVEHCARGLAGAGVAVGDPVVLHLRNCPEWLVAWFAIARVGGILTPSNVANSVGELEHVIGFTESRLVITEPALHPGVAEAVAALDADVTVITSLDDLPPGDGPVPLPAVGGDDVAELIFTSGTTRKPKAVMLTHANHLRAGLDSVHCLWLQEGERCLTALPLFHVNAQALTVLGTLTVGGTMVLVQEFRASRFWSQVRAHRATQTAIVAMQLRTLAARPPEPGEDEHDLRRVFYAINVTDAEKEEFERRFGVSLINGYGLSEAMTLVTVAPVVGPRRWPSIGLPSPGRRVTLQDFEGNEVPTREVGEIVVHGTPGRDFMRGYYRDEAATAEAIRDGCLYTGDNAYADEDGYLFFFDRKKDMIKRAGENVSAMEVEGALLEHPGVVEAAVIGVPDPIRDEAVAAVVVVAETAGPSADDLREHCGRLLARFKVPTVIRFELELPKTSIGKIRKDELRKRLEQQAD